jgi:hypothetical protein
MENDLKDPEQIKISREIFRQLSPNGEIVIHPYKGTWRVAGKYYKGVYECFSASTHENFRKAVREVIERTIEEILEDLERIPI